MLKIIHIQPDILSFCTRKFFFLFAFLLIANSGLIAQGVENYELVSVQFHGNRSIPTSELKKVIYSKESPAWVSKFLRSFTSFGEEPVYFDSTLITEDVAALKNYYQANGFFEARFWPKYYLDKEEKTATLVYHIEEGDPTLFGKFVIKGIDLVPPEYIKEIVDHAEVDTTQRYEKEIVQEKINFAMKYLRDHEYMLVESDRPIVVVDTLKDKADIELTIHPGKRYRISEVRVNKSGPGKDLVGDDLLKEIVGITPGNIYSYYDIQRGQVRLYRTNLFTSAIVNAVISDTANNKVPINITVDVGLMHELSPEIIVNNEDNAFNLGLSLGFIKKNFLGDARKVTVSTSAAAQDITQFITNPSLSDTTLNGYADARIAIEQPFLFGKPINTKFENYITLQKRKSEWNATLYGSKLSFDFELPQYTYFTSLSTYFNWEHTKYIYRDEYIYRFFQDLFNFLNLPDYGKELVDSLKSTPHDAYSVESTTSILGVNIGANKTNDIFFPSRGYSLSLILEDGNSIPYLINKIFNNQFTTPTFFKTILSSSFYIPYYSEPVNALGVKFKIGNIFTTSGTKFDIPLNQRFAAGGSNSVRGWSNRELVPPESDVSLDNITIQDLADLIRRGGKIGGFSLLEGSIESRNRLIGKFGSAVFVDYGNAFDSFKDFRLDKIAVAVGFGFRYYSEVIPIRVDFGIKAYDPNDQRSSFKKRFWGELFQFHLGIGEAF